MVTNVEHGQNTMLGVRREELPGLEAENTPITSLNVTAVLLLSVKLSPGRAEIKCLCSNMVTGVENGQNTMLGVRREELPGLGAENTPITSLNATVVLLSCVALNRSRPEIPCLDSNMMTGIENGQNTMLRVRREELPGLGAEHTPITRLNATVVLLFCGALSPSRAQSSVWAQIW